MAKPKVLGIVLAGGEGKRLMPLTLDRAKPAVPFGGSYRLIDFALSNLVNAGFLRLCVLTQYKSHSLDQHVSVTWRMSTLLGNYVTPVPAQQRRGKQWFLGSADAIYQSMNLIVDEQPDIIVVFGADHVYRMDASQMVEAHIESGCGRVGRGHPGAAQGRGPVRRDQDRRRRGPDRRVPREAGRPAGTGGQPGRVVRVDGQLRVHGRRPRQGARGGRAERRLPARHGRRHHPDAGRARRGRGLRLQAQRRAGLAAVRP